MKHVLTIIVAMLLTHITIAQKADIVTAVQKMNLKGEIWKIDEKEYEFEWENNQPKKGALKFISSYNFDAEGNLIEETYLSGKTQDFQRIEYKYSKPGVEIEKNIYNANRQITGKSIKEYNSNDFMTSWIQYDSANKIISKEIYVYEFISQKKYKVTIQSNQKQFVITVTLNSNNKMLSEVWTSGMTYSETYSYNERGLKISNINKDSKGNLDKEFLYEYDTIGNIIQEKYKNEAGYSSTDTYTYTYDLKNNWTIRLIKNKSITERDVKYFGTRATRVRRN